MGKPYSEDLRLRVVEAVEEGASRHEAAERFAISASSAIRWVAQFAQIGSVVAKPSGGSTSPLEQHAEFLLELIEQQLDLTLDEVVAAIRAVNISGSRSAVSRFYTRRRISFKKSLRAAEQKRPDVAKARQLWKRRQACLIRRGLSSSTRPAPTPP